MNALLELENMALGAAASDDWDVYQVSPTATATNAISNVSTDGEYLVKLDGPLNTTEAMRHFAGALESPELMKGTGDHGGEANFCLINGVMKQRIQASISDFKPTFVRINRALKQLSSHCASPTLGLIDYTLPQHRSESSKASFEPAQDQFPVPYFFYGTLACPDVLTEKLSLPRKPELQSASINGGVMTTWGKYRALVNGPAEAKVEGWMFQVETKDQEDVLRYYETDKYEVVRCVITMKDGKAVNGLTFRYRQPSNE